MANQPIQDAGSSRILQGCLFGAVGLFGVLLVVMIVLAYLRFQDMTQTRSTTGSPQVEAPPTPAAP